MNCNEVLCVCVCVFVCVFRIMFIFSSSREVSQLFSSSAWLQIYTQTPMISANSYLVHCCHRKIIPVLPQRLMAWKEKEKKRRKKKTTTTKKKQFGPCKSKKRNQIFKIMLHFAHYMWAKREHQCLSFHLSTVQSLIQHGERRSPLLDNK